MKLITYIISFLILSLAVAPCNDTFGCNVEQKVVVSQNTNDNQWHSVDLCSPFCSCTCCGIPSIYRIKIYHFSAFIQLQKIIYPVFKSALYSFARLSVLQPPKIG